MLSLCCPYIAPTLPLHSPHIASILLPHCLYGAPTLPLCCPYIALYIAPTLPLHCLYVAPMLPMATIDIVGDNREFEV